MLRNEIKVSHVQAIFAVNYMGLVRCCKSFLPILKQQAIEKTHTDARILNVISMAGIIAGPGMTPYFASKHAALAFTSGLRMELKAFGIQVSAVNPAFHETPLVNAIGDMLTSVWEGLPEERRKEYGEGTYCVLQSNRNCSSLFLLETHDCFNLIPRYDTRQNILSDTV
jgi:short-subunit dehydrogenase